MDRTYRPVRILMSSHTLRRLDDVVASGLGGFTSRDELVEEAVNSYLLELQDMAPAYSSEEGTAGHSFISHSAISADGAPNLSDVAFPGPGFASTGDPIYIEQGPMLGLHNRDWPSFWALGRLGLKASRAPIGFRDFLADVTEEAWDMVEELRMRMGSRAKAATQMLPTNPLKKQSSDAGFQNFAVATLSNKPGREGLHKASGPLPLWKAVSFSHIGTNTSIAVTPEGWKLLEIVQGLSPEAPHDQTVAGKFFDFLQENSPFDWWGFENVIREVADSPTREALLAGMESARDWSPSVAASATQGYIARCREWGLMEPKLIAGRYQLTDFGKETLKNV